jgi:hypothetical protein
MFLSRNNLEIINNSLSINKWTDKILKLDNKIFSLILHKL